MKTINTVAAVFIILASVIASAANTNEINTVLIPKDKLSIKKFSKDVPMVNSSADVIAKNVKINIQRPLNIIWSEDFSGGIPAGWNMVDNTGNSFDWVLNSNTANIVASFTNTSGIASASGGNYMLLFGDLYNTPTPPTGDVDMNAYFQTAAIPINGEPKVSVQFQQKFRLCCNANPTLDLLISTDPTFTTNVVTFNVNPNFFNNIASADPDDVIVDITAIAGGLVGNIYLRFHSITGGSHYYWMVDDIVVFEPELSCNNYSILKLKNDKTVVMPSLLCH